MANYALDLKGIYTEISDTFCFCSHLIGQSNYIAIPKLKEMETRILSSVSKREKTKNAGKQHYQQLNCKLSPTLLQCPTFPRNLTMYISTSTI